MTVYGVSTFTPTSQPWAANALCAQTDSELFYPDKGGSTQAAKRICGRCDVTAQCLDYAVSAGEQFGIFGGHSERERRAIRSVAGQP